MFSFIIVNYNTAGLTKACLESIFRFCNEADFEIILVDNNSLKADLNILETEFKNKIKIISNNKNLGFAKANNQGARIASGDYLFFLKQKSHNNFLAIKYSYGLERFQISKSQIEKKYFLHLHFL